MTKIKELFQKYREVIMYLLFGGLSFFLNMGLFWLIVTKLGMNALIGNVICWIIVVMFQFITNRLWVFDGKTDSFGAFLKQMGAFYGGRLLTLAIEEGIIFIFITLMKLPDMPVKLAAQVIVIVLNYVISKLLVFRKKDGE